MNASRKLAAWLSIASTLGCSSSESGPRGEYFTERTVVVTGLGELDEEGCGTPQGPKSGERALRYRVSGADTTLKVTDVVGGCVLKASLVDHVVVADEAVCSFAADAPLRQLGVISRKYSTFRLDPRGATVRTRSVTLATVVTGESRSCTVTDERIVEAR